jgi:hypothetical protein
MTKVFKISPPTIVANGILFGLGLGLGLAPIGLPMFGESRITYIRLWQYSILLRSSRALFSAIPLVLGIPYGLMSSVPVAPSWSTKVNLFFLSATLCFATGPYTWFLMHTTEDALERLWKYRWCGATGGKAVATTDKIGKGISVTDTNGKGMATTDKKGEGIARTKINYGTMTAKNDGTTTCSESDWEIVSTTSTERAVNGSSTPNDVTRGLLMEEQAVQSMVNSWAILNLGRVAMVGAAGVAGFVASLWKPQG